jgi:DedD protein
MDLRAKQRLTGAVILVALVVLLVPELLTGPGETRPADAPDNEGMREYTIDIDGQNPAAASPPPAERDTVVNLPAPAATTPADPGRALPGEEAAPAQPSPAQPSPAPSVPAAAATPNPMSAAPPVASTTPAAARPASTAPDQRAERGAFVVQLGTFSSRDNADRLARDMKTKGFSAFVVPVASNGRELFRVRVGPTRDRASAESLAAELKRAGQSGSIVPIS